MCVSITAEWRERMRQLKKIDSNELGFHERLQLELSNYPVKTFLDDGSVIIQYHQNPFFLTNDIWSIDFLKGIPQFKEMIDNYKGRNRNIHFQINSPSVN